MSTKKNTKKNYKKKGANKKVPNNKQLATRVKKLEKSEELKYIDNYSTLDADTGLLFNLTSIGQGDDFNQRVGEEIVAKYLNFKCFLTRSPATNVLSALSVRLILFWDMQTNGANPDMIASTSTLTGALLDDSTCTNLMLCPHNYRTKHRYHILMDKLVIINFNDIGSNCQKKVKKNLNLGGAKIKYSDSGSGISSQTSRSLHMFALSSATALMPTPRWFFRTWYTDA